MAGVETLGILEEIQALVLDKVQVVSYKWLSRNFSISSNDAKRLLQDFVVKHGSGLEVVYTLSGWLKSNPQAYHVSLVPGIKLSEIKQDFKDSCSVQVYSVQACIPKDPAVLWSTEFAQAEELFDQPSTVDNCLRDNRFCGVTYSCVQRNVDRKTASAAPNIPKIEVGLNESSRSNGVLQNAPIKQNETEIPVQPSTVATSVEKLAPATSKINVRSIKPSVSKETNSMLPSNKAKVQKGKTVTATEGSLANMWGRASTKLNAPNPAIGASSTVQDSVNIEDEEQHINFKRESSGGSARKRKVVIDFSDDEDDENIVNLASPGPPNGQLILDSSHDVVHPVREEKVPASVAIEPNELGAKKIKAECNSGPSVQGQTVHGSTDKTIDSSNEENKMKNNNAVAQSTFLPRRKKVLKTQIDGRGREVTEVVWEDEEAEAIDASKEPLDKTSETRNATAVKGPPTGATAPSISNAMGKAGNKKTAKGGSKDAKQGNILSFFKKI